MFNQNKLLQVKKILAQSYGNLQDSLKRNLIVTPIKNCYGTIGSFLFSLEGSPPKGYAIYSPEHRKIILINAWLEKVRTMNDFEMEVEDGSN